MKSVSSWREMLFRFMCYFSRDSFAWLLSLWPSPDPSKCGRAQGSSLNFLSPLLTVILGVISTQPWEFNCPLDTDGSKVYLSSPVLIVSIQLSTWRFHMNTHLSPNVPKSALLISTLLLHPLPRARQSFPGGSLNGNPSALLLRP